MHKEQPQFREKPVIKLIPYILSIVVVGFNLSNNADANENFQKYSDQLPINNSELLKKCTEENALNDGKLPPVAETTYLRQFRCSENFVYWYIFKGAKNIGTANVVYWLEKGNHISLFNFQIEDDIKEIKVKIDKKEFIIRSGYTEIKITNSKKAKIWFVMKENKIVIG
jgi:hypothetical protein